MSENETREVEEGGEVHSRPEPGTKITPPGSHYGFERLVSINAGPFL